MLRRVFDTRLPHGDDPARPHPDRTPDREARHPDVGRRERLAEACALLAVALAAAVGLAAHELVRLVLLTGA